MAAPPARATTETATAATSEGRGALTALAGRFAMPVGLAFVTVLLLVWIGAQPLDSIERRQLDLSVLARRVVEHLELALVSTAIVVVLAVALGVLLTRPALRAVTPAAVAVANIGQAIPSIGLLVLMAIVIGIGADKAILALVVYSFLPVLRNTMVGLRGVDRSLIEAGRGMGMSLWQTLRRVELPLAVPVILAGVRTALAINVGTATLATFVDGGGLGDTITAGIRLGRETVLIAGAALTAVLALALDWAAGWIESALRPRGL
jgi:osmoprotectant transport system permease protein